MEYLLRAGYSEETKKQRDKTNITRREETRISQAPSHMPKAEAQFKSKGHTVNPDKKASSQPRRACSKKNYTIKIHFTDYILMRACISAITIFTTCPSLP